LDAGAAVSPERLAEIRDRQNHGGVWSPREVQMKADIADLLAYVDALTAKPEKVAPARIARWGPLRYRRGGMALRGNGRILGHYEPVGLTGQSWHASPGWGYPRFVVYVEAEARHYVEAEAAKRGWTVAP
jgi:hypothetical protein